MGRSVAARGRPGGRGPRLRRAGACARPALASLPAGRLADAARPGDLRVDRGRRRLGRAAAPLRAGPRPGLRLAAVPRGAGRPPASSRAGAPSSTSSAPAPSSRDPGRGLSRHGGRRRGAGRADRLGADPPRRPADRPGRARRPRGDGADRGLHAGRRRVRRLRRAGSGPAGRRARRLPSQRRGHTRLARRLDEALGALPELRRLCERRAATAPRGRCRWPDRPLPDPAPPRGVPHR